MIFTRSGFSRISPQLESSISETQGFSSTIFLKFSNLRKPERRVRPISPDAVGQEGHFSWQTVAASSRMLRGRRGRLMIREV